MVVDNKQDRFCKNYKFFFKINLKANYTNRVYSLPFSSLTLAVHLVFKTDILSNCNCPVVSDNAPEKEAASLTENIQMEGIIFEEVSCSTGLRDSEELEWTDDGSDIADKTIKFPKSRKPNQAAPVPLQAQLVLVLRSLGNDRPSVKANGGLFG